MADVGWCWVGRGVDGLVAWLVGIVFGGIGEVEGSKNVVKV